MSSSSLPVVMSSACHLFYRQAAAVAGWPSSTISSLSSHLDVTSFRHGFGLVENETDMEKTVVTDNVIML